jgi:hypothetical protein
MQKLLRVATAVSREQDALERARLMAELERMTGSALERAIVGAHRAGYSWRTIGTHLGIPFQTVHRRYGGELGGRHGFDRPDNTGTVEGALPRFSPAVTQSHV